MPATPADVRAAYRIILRREPENEQVVQDLCASGVESHHLLKLFFSSLEYRRKFGPELADFMELMVYEREMRERNVAGGTISVKTAFGDFSYDMPHPGEFLSAFVFGIHKGGSSLLVGIMSAALEAAGLPQVDIPDAAFEAGVTETQLLNPQDIFFRYGYYYLGFRGFPDYLHDMDIRGNKKVLLIRDPRDIVVSYYFSMLGSHVMPSDGIARADLESQRSEAMGMSIDEYCLSKAAIFVHEFESYKEVLLTELRLYRYEDVIFHKVEWLTDMVRYFDIRLPLESIESIATKHDIFPAEESVGEHIRQVRPGNHKKHLRSGTIASLNNVFGEVLTKFGYTP